MSPEPQLGVTLQTLAAERLPDVIDIWLWEFEEPENWPDVQAVQAAIVQLQGRADSRHPAVQSAIEKCQDFLATS